jgi:hypothetical protein
MRAKGPMASSRKSASYGAADHQICLAAVLVDLGAWLLPVIGGRCGTRRCASSSISIEVIFGFGLSSQQSILYHVKQRLLNSLVQRHGLLGTQKHSRHGDFPS